MEATKIDMPGWESLTRFTDRDAGLDCIIALHDTTLGPGCGGARMRQYSSFEDAARDVAQLSRGMTYKNALGGIPFGGGKAVILGDPKRDKTPALFAAFGRAIDSLGGTYVSAEDSGINESDLRAALTETTHVAGVAEAGKGGNPSPFTADGVFEGLRAAVRAALGRDDFDGLTVAIQGVGAVGMPLAEQLHAVGASLIVADVDEAALAHAKDRFGASIVPPDACCAADADIFSPCAFGGAISPETIATVKARIVGGAANNQLATPEMDAALKDRGILYAPDYVINAAGVISVGLEYHGQWTADALRDRIENIGVTLSEVFRRAAADDRPTGAVADDMAEDVIAEAASAARAGEAGGVQ